MIQEGLGRYLNDLVLLLLHLLLLL